MSHKLFEPKVVFGMEFVSRLTENDNFLVNSFFTTSFEFLFDQTYCVDGHNDTPYTITRDIVGKLFPKIEKLRAELEYFQDLQKSVFEFQSALRCAELSENLNAINHIKSTRDCFDQQEHFNIEFASCFARSQNSINMFTVRHKLFHFQQWSCQSTK